MVDFIIFSYMSFLLFRDRKVLGNELHLTAVDQLADESLFKIKHGFKLNAHLEQCQNFCKILRKQAEHVKKCNRGVGMFVYLKSS